MKGLNEAPHPHEEDHGEYEIQHTKCVHHELGNTRTRMISYLENDKERE